MSKDKQKPEENLDLVGTPDEEHEESHGWIDSSGFDEVDTEDDLDDFDEEDN